MSKCSVSDGHVHFSSMLSLTILKMLRNSVLFQQKETLRAVFFHFLKRQEQFLEMKMLPTLSRPRSSDVSLERTAEQFREVLKVTA